MRLSVFFFYLQFTIGSFLLVNGGKDFHQTKILIKHMRQGQEGVQRGQLNPSLDKISFSWEILGPVVQN